MDKDDTKDIDLENNNDEELDLEGSNDSGADATDWKAEALKYKSIAKRYKAKVEQKPQEHIIKREETPREQIKPSDILRADEFKLYRQGYSEQEIDLIMHNGGIKALEDDKSPLAIGLRVSREQRIAEEAAAKAEDTSGMSELERKYTKADLENMTVAELDKILPHAN